MTEVIACLPNGTVVVLATTTTNEEARLIVNTTYLATRPAHKTEENVSLA